MTIVQDKEGPLKEKIYEEQHIVLYDMNHRDTGKEDELMIDEGWIADADDEQEFVFNKHDPSFQEVIIQERH